MALQDHFRPPLSVRRHWHAFHNAWATYISSDLNQRLPEGYFAEANVQFGIEIDVATIEEAELESPHQVAPGNGDDALLSLPHQRLGARMPPAGTRTQLGTRRPFTCTSYAEVPRET